MSATHTSTGISAAFAFAAGLCALTTQTMKAPGPFYFKDLVFGGAGTVYGTVAEKGVSSNTPLRRRVLLLAEIERKAIRETWSDKETGTFAFEGLNTSKRYTTLAYDYAHNYRAVAADNLLAEVPP